MQITFGELLQVLRTQRSAKAEGFSDVLYLDAVENKYVEEVSSCNIFVVKVWFFLLEWHSIHYLLILFITYQ